MHDTSFWSISRYDIKVERRMGIRFDPAGIYLLWDGVNVGESDNIDAQTTHQVLTSGDAGAVGGEGPVKK